MGRGLGLIDIHLLISALLSDVLFWTLDKKLKLRTLTVPLNPLSLKARRVGEKLKTMNNPVE
jgi:hypothetical protein